MDYILRKFKENQKRLTTPKMVITSPATKQDSPQFNFEESLSIHSSPIRHNQLNHLKHNHNSHPQLYNSQYSLNSSPSRSSCSSEDVENGSNINISTIRKVILGRPVLVRRNCFQEVEPQINDNAFVMDCLDWHNLLRAKHGSPPLTISHRLVAMAQEWANYLAHTDSYQYRNCKDVGENLMCKWTCHPDFDPPGESIVKFWYSEIELYNFQIDPSILHTLANHFTQIVWKSTQEFGVGKAHTRGGKLIVVANYRPAGNIIGLFHENVLPPITDEDHKKIHGLDESLNDSSIQSQSSVSH